MKHELTIDGYAFRLRPISDLDAEFILNIRNNQLLNRYLHPISDRIEDQIAWLHHYYTRLNDYYFVIERRKTGNPEGLISVYDIDLSSRCGEWGRWIICKESLAAVESAWLIYRVAFELLNLDIVYSRTIADNRRVVSFHDACGITSRNVLKQHFKIGDEKFDAIQHNMKRENWVDIEPFIQKIARLTARKLTHA